VVVDPLPWAARLLRSDGGTAIVTLIDPARRPAPLATLWREAFELTRCEAALAVLLVAGHSLESAASIRDCRPATLRVHLRRIFAKTGTARQSDLVALLMRIGRRQG
jgi:DNA-binding CsgD family transcriptional regulator